MSNDGDIHLIGTYMAEYLDGALEQRLNEAVATANYRLTLTVQRSNAKLKLQKDLIYAINGGLFEVSPELIAFVNTLIAVGKEEAVLLDVNKNPIEIHDLADFLDAIIDHYYESVNTYLVEFKSLQKTRTAKALIGE